MFMSPALFRQPFKVLYRIFLRLKLQCLVVLRLIHVAWPATIRRDVFMPIFIMLHFDEGDMLHRDIATRRTRRKNEGTLRPRDYNG